MAGSLSRGESVTMQWVSEKVTLLAEMPASGQSSWAGRRSHKTSELDELGQQCSHICGANGDQNEEPIATVLFDPLDQGSALGEIWFADWVESRRQWSCNNGVEGVYHSRTSQQIHIWLLSKGRLEIGRTISFSRPTRTVHRPSTTPDGYERTSILIVILHGKQYIRQYTNVSYNDW